MVLDEYPILYDALFHQTFPEEVVAFGPEAVGDAVGYDRTLEDDETVIDDDAPCITPGLPAEVEHVILLSHILGDGGFQEPVTQCPHEESEVVQVFVHFSGIQFGQGRFPRTVAVDDLAPVGGDREIVEGALKVLDHGLVELVVLAREDHAFAPILPFPLTVLDMLVEPVQDILRFADVELVPDLVIGLADEEVDPGIVQVGTVGALGQHVPWDLVCESRPIG